MQTKQTTTTMMMIFHTHRKKEETKIHIEKREEMRCLIMMVLNGKGTVEIFIK
jgi:hypothetical protein